jgi:cell division protein FtsZ
MQDAGSALMGIGKATGEERAIEAARAAVNSPLLEVSIDGARGVLFSVSGGDDLTMYEINEAAKVITGSIHPDAKVIFGAVLDEELRKGELKVTVIATGFSDTGPSMRGVSGEKEEREGAGVSAKSDTSNNSGKHIQSDQSKDDEAEEDWDIPAFIRKKMK